MKFPHCDRHVLDANSKKPIKIVEATYDSKYELVSVDELHYGGLYSAGVTVLPVRRGLRAEHLMIDTVIEYEMYNKKKYFELPFTISSGRPFDISLEHDSVGFCQTETRTTITCIQYDYEGNDRLEKEMEIDARLGWFVDVSMLNLADNGYFLLAIGFGNKEEKWRRDNGIFPAYEGRKTDRQIVGIGPEGMLAGSLRIRLAITSPR
ncbi:hypothetical protein TKK_0003664 [Trichogramma kaykai]|uniref:Uncharacterized protein n=1 Tax=Trichogramma kaykai TaxID=54128 RepID=A0ABD2XNI0_9HYME